MMGEENNKRPPATMGVREWLIKRLSAQMVNIPQNVISKIVTHNYETAYAALKEYDSIEIAGFGDFFYNRKKAQEFMKKCVSQKNLFNRTLEEEELTSKRRRNIEMKLSTVMDNIEALNKKGIYEEREQTTGDVQRMEESVGSVGRDGKGRKTYKGQEDSDM